jgi:hypothetical protein
LAYPDSAMKKKNIDNLAKTVLYDPVQKVTSAPRSIVAMAKEFENSQVIIIITNREVLNYRNCVAPIYCGLRQKSLTFLDRKKTNIWYRSFI